MFHVRLLLCLSILVFAKAETAHFVRGEIINPASRIIGNNNEYKTKTSQKAPRRTPPASSYGGPAAAGPGTKRNGNNQHPRLQRILEFQAVKKYSGSQPTRRKATY